LFSAELKPAVEEAAVQIEDYKVKLRQTILRHQNELLGVSNNELKQRMDRIT